PSPTAEAGRGAFIDLLPPLVADFVCGLRRHRPSADESSPSRLVRLRSRPGPAAAVASYSCRLALQLRGHHAPVLAEHPVATGVREATGAGGPGPGLLVRAVAERLV